MRLAVIGAGHVGLVAAACLAEMGNQVLCIDKDKEKIQELSQGTMPIFEPGLQEIVQRNLREERLSFDLSIARAVQESEVIFIAVATPATLNGSPDLSAVEEVSRDIAKHIKDYRVIAEKSTVPVHTGERVRRTLKLHNTSGADFDVVSVPEFLREGSAVQDFLHPDRIVVGVDSHRAEMILRQLFEPLNAPLVVTSIQSAELIKHASNCFLAMKISYVNALANLCELVDADVTVVTTGMGLDKRIGTDFLSPGVGFGGSCFPKDLAAFIHMAEEVGYDFRILKEVDRVNRDQRSRLVKKLRETLWVLQGKTIGVLGLAFKPNTDDLREAPSLDIILALLQEGARIKTYDPAAMENARRLFKEGVEFCPDPYEVARGSDALVLLTEWEEFRNLDMARIKNLLSVPIIVDGRNVYDPATLKSLGIEYHGVGR